MGKEEYIIDNVKMMYIKTLYKTMMIAYTISSTLIYKKSFGPRLDDKDYEDIDLILKYIEEEVK